MSTSGHVDGSPPSFPAVLSVALLGRTCVLLHCPVPQRSLSNHKAFTAVYHQLTASVGKSVGPARGHGLCGERGRAPGLYLCPGDLDSTGGRLDSILQEKTKIPGGVQDQANDALGAEWKNCRKTRSDKLAHQAKIFSSYGKWGHIF